MDFNFYLVLAILVIAVVGVILKHYFPDEEQDEYKLHTNNIPLEMVKSKIWSKEKKFFSARLKLVSKPDVVFKKGNVLSVGEVKSRNTYKAYQSDIIQMSVGKAILEDLGNNVDNIGLLKVCGKEDVKWIRVNLMNKDELNFMINKYRNLKNGKETGLKCSNKTICSKCEYFDVC